MRDMRAHARAEARIIASEWCPPSSTIVAEFERHRLVYDLLTAEFADGLHALALVAKAPGEP